ncbi:signal peptidase I [Paenibacillus mesophilus]|uniref:signal peptidase I n=1 Tax=Paenibacillus mesophilus TaxID=2582849 RepID=UPI00110D84C8|nr:signal peptidase I [Paenibacillus mesophilus]TMV45140.1 signal peptidase I [Paenibacillus mesophilus]
MGIYESQDGREAVTAAATEQIPTRSVAEELWDWTKSIAVALVIVILLNMFVFNLSTVKGHSMEPTLREKEWLFVNKLTFLIGHPDRGDVVILKDPDMQSVDRQYLVKRVVATPGDKVEIRGGKLYVNGEAVSEPYTDIKIEDGDRGPIVVEEGRYFVMGDNRHQLASKDSRTFGTVPEKAIQGRAEFILWPLRQMGGL